jgi:nickel superoxide dismutase
MRNGTIWKNIKTFNKGGVKMEILTNKKTVIVLFTITGVLIIGSVVYSHCQLPCGIYDDDARFNMIAENITTIEKSMNMINQLSGEQKPNMNQIVRWVQNKDTHADELSEVVTYYFMTQRITPVEKTDAQAYENYITKLTLLHKMLISAMKSKQTTDLSFPKQLTELMTDFKKAYYEGAEHKH